MLKDVERVVPHHGELWCSIAKQTANRRKSVGAILKLVAEATPGP